MKLNSKNGWALLLIFIGTLILLNYLGPGIAYVLSLIFPLALIGFGVLGIKNGRPVIGWGLTIIGLMMLLPKFSGWIGLLLAVALIGLGVYMFKGRRIYD